MENRFDELAKSLASGVSRREALRQLGGGLAGALLASFGLAKGAEAAVNSCAAACAQYHGAAHAQCMQVCKSCPSPQFVTGGPFTCGPSTPFICCQGQPCCGPNGNSISCCTSGEACANGICVSTALTCSNGELCPNPSAPCNTLNPECACFITTEGASVCAYGDGNPCAFPTCTSSLDCAPGTVCVAAGCCPGSAPGMGVCLSTQNFLSAPPPV
jgi:hypothetical protein